MQSPNTGVGGEDHGHRGDESPLSGMCCSVSPVEYAKALNKAKAWRVEHADHVQKLEASCTHDPDHEPSREDLRHPELWKAASWRWLRIMFK